MKKIVVTKTSPDWIKLVKEEKARKKARFEKHFEIIKDRKS